MTCFHFILTVTLRVALASKATFSSIHGEEASCASSDCHCCRHGMLSCLHFEPCEVHAAPEVFMVQYFATKSTTSGSMQETDGEELRNDRKKSNRSKLVDATIEACDWQCYLSRYPDLQTALGATNTAGAEAHYLAQGQPEGRDCTCSDAAIEACDWQCYLRRYPDLQTALGATNTAGAEAHYLEHGQSEGRGCTCSDAAIPAVTQIYAPLPTCTYDGEVHSAGPPPRSAPRSWEENVQNGVSPEAGDCYSPGDAPRDPHSRFTVNRVDSATCCCAFWHTEPPKDSAIVSAKPECTESFSNTTFEAADSSTCRFVVALSGVTTPNIDCILDNYERYVISEGVCAVAFVTAQDVNSTRDSFLRKSWIKAFVIEPSDVHSKVDDAITRCTGGVLGKYEEELRNRFFLDGRNLNRALGSFAPMHRKIWMAHLLSRRLKSLELVARARIDFVWHQPFNWPAALEESISQQGVLAAEAKPGVYMGRKEGVPPMHRCMFDDQFAVGLPDAMDGYASVYPDFEDFARVLLIHRNDQTGHHNERVLTQHLHYRNVNVVASGLVDGDIRGRGC